jgi:hypothetical protein
VIGTVAVPPPACRNSQPAKRGAALDAQAAVDESARLLPAVGERRRQLGDRELAVAELADEQVLLAVAVEVEHVRRGMARGDVDRLIAGEDAHRRLQFLGLRRRERGERGAGEQRPHHEAERGQVHGFLQGSAGREPRPRTLTAGLVRAARSTRAHRPSRAIAPRETPAPPCMGMGMPDSVRIDDRGGDGWRRGPCRGTELAVVVVTLDWSLRCSQPRPCVGRAPCRIAGMSNAPLFALLARKRSALTGPSRHVPLPSRAMLSRHAAVANPMRCGSGRIDGAPRPTTQP